MINIKKITWEQTLAIWTDNMPNMSLEPTSAMSCMKDFKYDEKTEQHEQIDRYDLENQKFTPTFWGAFHNDELVGVNSGHMTLDRMYRSRGLFVKEEYRGIRIAQKLLLKTISQGYFEKAIGVWSYPNRKAWMSYHHVGFTLTGHTFNFEWEICNEGLNAKAIRIIDSEELLKLETPQTIVL